MRACMQQRTTGPARRSEANSCACVHCWTRQHLWTAGLRNQPFRHTDLSAQSHKISCEISCVYFAAALKLENVGSQFHSLRQPVRVFQKSSCAGEGSRSVLNEHSTKDAPTLERWIGASQSTPLDERVAVGHGCRRTDLVALPPGHAKLSARAGAAGWPATGNTLRVVHCSGQTVERCHGERG